jgi:hypothetical protein
MKVVNSVGMPFALTNAGVAVLNLLPFHLQGHYNFLVVCAV